MADGNMIYTRVTYRKLPGAKFAGALWQDSRLVWVCEHSHGWQGSAKSCADGTAERWPGREKDYEGPRQTCFYRLPELPDIRKGPS